jgi:vitamin B12 transporter
MKRILDIFIICLISHALILVCYGKSNAQNSEELEILRMFYKEKDLVVTTTRHEKPISQVAENVTIVSAAEIKEMNSHTLADVLNHVPGVQLDIRGGIGSVSNINIQGSDYRHVLVMIDGVTLNNLSDNFADIGAIPVQYIERVEIIKGPASSSWGSSLGGVINIVTKPAGEYLAQNVTISASYGEKGTGDFRAETFGTAGRAGYYLSAGRIESDGFIPNHSVENNNVYAKVQTDIRKSSKLSLTTGYIDGMKGMGQDTVFGLSFDNNFEYIFSSLLFSASPTSRTDFEISINVLEQDNNIFVKDLNTGTELSRTLSSDKSRGGSLKLVSRADVQTFVIGADYEKGILRSNNIKADKHTIEKWAIYFNDTVNLDKLSLTPGIRYDDISTNDSFISPSLGATYKLNKGTLLRADIARGFNVPPLPYSLGTGFFYNPNPDLEVEKVLSYQVGIETTVIGGLWLKSTVFRHDVEDAIVDRQEINFTFTKINQDEIRRQGIELELETAAVRNVSFRGGFLYQDARNLEDDERLKNIAEYTVDLGLRYDDKESLTGLLAGHYIWWNSSPGFNGEYSSIIWDLNVNKCIYKENESSADAFVSVHNLFNGSQYLIDAFKNPGRWVEAGIRMSF